MPDWVSVKISRDAYTALRRNVPKHGASVQALVRTYVEQGLLWDEIRSRSPADLEKLLQNVMDVIRLEAKRK